MLIKLYPSDLPFNFDMIILTINYLFTLVKKTSKYFRFNLAIFFYIQNPNKVLKKWPRPYSALNKQRFRH